MIIYLRHANDSDDNDKKNRHNYKHDNHITKKGKEDAKEMTHKLIEKYGYPTKIYYSPFLRCRETLTVMMKELLYKKTGYIHDFCLHCTSVNDYDNIVNLVCDSNLSRYFTKSDRKKPRVSKSTLRFGIPIHEKKTGLYERLDNHIKFIKKEDSKETIWCITHAVIYKKIADKFKIETPDHIEFLEYFIVNNDT